MFTILQILNWLTQLSMFIVTPYILIYFLEDALSAVPSSSILDQELVLYLYIYICTISCN